MIPQHEHFLKSSFLSVQQEIDALSNTKFQISQEIRVKLENLRALGHELFKQDPSLIKKVMRLSMDTDEHLFILNQLMGFYCPEYTKKSIIESVFSKQIYTFANDKASDVLMYLKIKIKIIRLYGPKTDDPRTDPIMIFNSCKEISKLLYGANLVF